MLHLACRTLGHVVAVHGRYSENEELPDIPEIRDQVLGLLGSSVTYIEVPVWGDWEIFERAGRFFWSLKPRMSAPSSRHGRPVLLARLKALRLLLARMA